MDTIIINATLPTPEPITVVISPPAAVAISITLATQPATTTTLYADVPAPEPITIVLAAAPAGPPGPAGSGLPWITLDEAAFDALATKDDGTIYDVLLEDFPTL